MPSEMPGTALPVFLVTEQGARFWLLLWPEALLYVTEGEGKCRYIRSCDLRAVGSSIPKNPALKLLP